MNRCSCRSSNHVCFDCRQPWKNCTCPTPEDKPLAHPEETTATDGQGNSDRHKRLLSPGPRVNVMKTLQLFEMRWNDPDLTSRMRRARLGA